MNKYLITALYVIAGCAVAVPLKAQNSGELLRVERCRLLIANATKTISIYIETDVPDCSGLPSDYCCFSKFDSLKKETYFDHTLLIYRGSLCRTSYKIRAPETLYSSAQF